MNSVDKSVHASCLQLMFGKNSHENYFSSFYFWSDPPGRDFPFVAGIFVGDSRVSGAGLDFPFPSSRGGKLTGVGSDEIPRLEDESLE